MNAIAVGDKSIGPGRPCFVAAEIGINHNGSLSLAHEMIDAAADSGVDGIKFQNYAIEDFLFDDTLTHTYVSQGKTVTESQIEMFRRCSLKREWIPELEAHCDRRGVIFFSTPTGESGVRDLVAAGCRLLKNGSDFLGNLPLIEILARTGLPTILSTGMATQAEMADAVRAFRSAGGRELILLHCTSSYPTPDEDVNLRKIPAMREAFGCPVGLSDHTRGIVAAIGAAALGACFIEKHFTTDKNFPGPDHSFSADPAEMKALVQGVRTLEEQLGTAALEPAASEVFGRRDYRLSCVAVRALKAGTRIEKGMIGFSRPGTGWPPAESDLILGRALKYDVKAGHVFGAADFA